MADTVWSTYRISPVQDAHDEDEPVAAPASPGWRVRRSVNHVQCSLSVQQFLHGLGFTKNLTILVVESMEAFDLQILKVGPYEGIGCISITRGGRHDGAHQRDDDKN